MLSHLNIKNANYIRNASVDILIDNAVKLNEGVIGHNGALMVDTGEFSGRIPKDKFIVEEDFSSNNIWWGDINQPISEKNFNHLYNKVIETYNNLDKDFYVFDGFAGDDKKNSINVRMLTKKAWQSLFVNNIFIRPEQSDLENFTPDFTIINAFDVKEKDWKEFGLNSENFIVFNLKRKIAIIGGTEYAGEMKKGIFSIMHYYLPLKNVLSMHCSANVSKDLSESALFFGLSGTGKTTLSTNADRSLIGDDEHGWSDDGIFNFEGGCYAKAINLNKEKEPEIYNAIRHGSLLENVVYDLETKEVDFDDNSKSENSRICYPINFVENSLGSKGLPSAGPHPNAVIFLTCDAYGIMPPVGKLDLNQAMYHFISGYTAKMGGTEIGVVDPVAAFSSCYGGPFLTLHPLVYAKLLKEKLEKHQADVFLVNTGWSGSSATLGSKRIDLKLTKHIISLILNKNLNFSHSVRDEFFNIEIPTNVDGIENQFLVPNQGWNNLEKYYETGNMLVDLFNKNFSKFDISDSGILSSSPKKV
ncbi:MAG TPA: phosphoenolpyruvate carboxykinase (ATP) [Candidatus Marinimicrobia bacterium]|nr:phosphoenolpyruvate carboxykinase (ATP) [Candidatus Neomarinimicrobiota bacterium]